ncbi:hypothetical protein PRIPAC_79140 [Pristionchus pacificus]|uniref:Uncharacterized protein n=1 Tax=Pristionchus pacificus TaxID=54126 RepID=A0A2A6BXH2_PRIPA|nr:hypothetical protein PRIPAC_79140 [Pristionchus pacificus]|eukprot:PDM70461.1 hypothetical protein PRIPAC_46707 [Pristionchus pacificus]
MEPKDLVQYPNVQTSRSIIKPDNECTTPVTTPPKMTDSITRFGIRLTPARNSPKNLSTFAAMAEMKVMERHQNEGDHSEPSNHDEIDGPSSDWVKRGEAALACAFCWPLYLPLPPRNEPRETRDPHAALASLGHLLPLDVRENTRETREGTPGMGELLASLSHLHEEARDAREPHASLADNKKKIGLVQRVFSTLRGRKDVVRPEVSYGQGEI